MRSQSSPFFISLQRVGLVKSRASCGASGISIPAAFTASRNLAGLAVAIQTVGVLVSMECLVRKTDTSLERLVLSTKLIGRFSKKTGTSDDVDDVVVCRLYYIIVGVREMLGY